MLCCPGLTGGCHLVCARRTVLRCREILNERVPNCAAAWGKYHEEEKMPGGWTRHAMRAATCFAGTKTPAKRGADACGPALVDAAAWEAIWFRGMGR
eukprot:2702615-Rhodomonas_salina.3